MSKYLFILGKDPQLSLAELYGVYPQAHFVEIERDFVVLELDQALSQADLNRLGGVIKLAQILAETRVKELREVLFEQIFYSKEGGKIEYGLSVYGFPERQLRPLLLDLKRMFKAVGANSRFANQNFENLSVPQYKGLRKKGKEWLIVKGKSGFYVAQGVGVQDIDAYSLRDYHKPFRNMQVGMLPPKLAQILINLTQAQGGQTIWDPFCGGGGLLMEGVLSGHPMMGSDLNPQTLEGAKRNMAWLQKQFGTSLSVELFEHDATEPLQGKFPDAIAFEGYLGPPQRGPLDLQRQAPLIRELEGLYVRFFKALQKVHFQGPIVAALPFFHARQGEVHLEGAIQKIEALGFKAEPLLPQTSKTFLTYARKEQWVGRRVMRWRAEVRTKE